MLSTNDLLRITHMEVKDDGNHDIWTMGGADQALKLLGKVHGA